MHNHVHMQYAFYGKLWRLYSNKATLTLGEGSSLCLTELHFRGVLWFLKMLNATKQVTLRRKSTAASQHTCYGGNTLIAWKRVNEKQSRRLEIVEIIVSQAQLLLTVQAIRVKQQVFPQRDGTVERARRFYHPALEFQFAGLRMPPEDSGEPLCLVIMSCFALTDVCYRDLLCFLVISLRCCISSPLSFAGISSAVCSVCIHLSKLSLQNKYDLNLFPVPFSVELCN